MNHRRYLSTLGALAILAMSLTFLAPARAAEEKPAPKPKFNPALIYLSSGAENDSSFINSARNGINRAENEMRAKVSVTQMTPKDDPAEIIKKIADTGASPIILLGNQNVAPILKLAERYPNSNFTIIDGLVPPLYPNVQSILFKDHEGAFLVGIIAGKMSRSSTVGFIGGMDVPLIRNFATGFTQGVHYAAPDTKVLSGMVGTTSDAWSNPNKAHEIAIDQYRENADIIFAAAGGSTVGVLRAANETGKFGIGVDTNQNGLFPGHVLTSLVKRVDVAVYETLKNSEDGSWSAGIKYLGIKEGALDYAVDQNNRNLISESLIEAVATAKDRIISGAITVESYTAK